MNTSKLNESRMSKATIDYSEMDVNKIREFM